jgi:hypothetical protein
LVCPEGIYRVVSTCGRDLPYRLKALILSEKLKPYNDTGRRRPAFHFKYPSSPAQKLPVRWLHFLSARPDVTEISDRT